MSWDLLSIQPKRRNVTAGTGRSGEGNYSGWLLPYEMQTKCFAIMQHSHGVFFPADTRLNLLIKIIKVLRFDFCFSSVLLFIANVTTHTPSSLVPNWTHSHLVTLVCLTFIIILTYCIQRWANWSCWTNNTILTRYSFGINFFQKLWITSYF